MNRTTIEGFVPADSLLLADGAIPLTWWTVTPNFGDQLSPFLVSRLAGRQVRLVELKPGRGRRLERWNLVSPKASYLAIGSIISRANARSIVWGSGAFGTERKSDLNPDAAYLAVRGPLTRNMLRMQGIDCPAIYGDPALLLPKVFNPTVKKRYSVGLVLRWAESEWNERPVADDVRKIYLGTDDVEQTLHEMLACERIISSSLHGLVLADAYGIPSAWLASNTPKGLEFKFYDYFLGVGKMRKPQEFDFSGATLVTGRMLDEQMEFTDGSIEFDERALLDACPFLARTTESAASRFEQAG